MMYGLSPDTHLPYWSYWVTQGQFDNQLAQVLHHLLWLYSLTRAHPIFFVAGRRYLRVPYTFVSYSSQISENLGIWSLVTPGHSFIFVSFCWKWAWLDNFQIDDLKHFSNNFTWGFAGHHICCKLLKLAKILIFRLHIVKLMNFSFFVDLWPTPYKCLYFALLKPSNKTKG